MLKNIFHAGRRDVKNNLSGITDFFKNTMFKLLSRCLPGNIFRRLNPFQFF